MQTVSFDDRLLAEVNEAGRDFEKDVRIGTAIWFYLQHKLTLGQAAQLAGDSQFEFMNRLSLHNFASLDHPAEDLRAET